MEYYPFSKKLFKGYFWERLYKQTPAFKYHFKVSYANSGWMYLCKMKQSRTELVSLV